MSVILLFAWWAHLACSTTVYESVTYCTSSFTCVDGVCSYEGGNTCSSGTFTEASCGVGITCRPNGDNFCCSPNSVGGTYCTSLADEGRFNTKVLSDCVVQANCVRVTHFCSYQLVTAEEGTGSFILISSDGYQLLPQTHFLPGLKVSPQRHNSSTKLFFPSL